MWRFYEVLVKMGFRSSQGKREVKGAALAETRAFRPYVPAVCLDDMARNGETDAAAATGA